MKRILFFLLFLSMLPLAVSASELIDGIYYDLDVNTKTAKVVYHRKYYYSGDVVIPSSVTYNGVEYSVTNIGDNAFSGSTDLTSINIPNSVTNIGRDAFTGCSNMTKVKLDNNAIVSKDYNGTPYISDMFGGQVKEYVLGEHVTRIGQNAFSHNNLTSVTIPASVTNIGYCAFDACFYLTAIHITDIAAWCKIQRESSSNGYYKNPFYVPYHLYLNDEEIKDLVIPDGVETIGYSTFSGCSELTSVSVPNSVTSIGEDAFAGCVGLTSVTLGNNVASIGPKAFSGCSGLTSIAIPANVTNIGLNAFQGCIGLTAVHVSDLGAWCSIEGGGSASNPLEYAHHLYLNGEEVKDLVIPDGVTNIGSYAFSGCSALTSVTIPNSVTSIGDYAFKGCTGLTAIDIPNGVTSIGSGAFTYCPELASITVANSVISIGSDVFYGTTWYNNQPDGLVYVGNVAYKYKGTMPDETSVVIKDGTCSIAGSAFAGCTGLVSVTLPNSVTCIGSEAFERCSGLTTITIPDGVTSISWYAFYECTGLTSVTIPYGVTSIESHAFYNCSSLTSIIFPNSMTSIGIGAFYNCSNLTSIVIPNSVTSIDNFAFSGNKNLTDVYCYAEMLQLDSDVFGYGYYSNATLHVPEGSLDAYRSAEWWKYFGSIVALTNSDPKPTGITSINNDVMTVERYYTIDGKHTITPQRGLNIVRMNDGTTKKIVIK